MSDDELDPKSTERLHRFLEESTGHPVPTGLEGRVVPHARRRRRAGRALGAVLVFAVVAGATAAVLISTRGTPIRPQTAGGPTPAPGTAMPAASAYGPSVGQIGGTEILGLTGASWSAVTAPAPSPANSVEGSTLLGITCPTADDCWAIGYFGGADGGLIAHYDGHAWSVFIETATTLLSVACASRTDCWAVGGGGEGETAVLVHYDGSVWSTVAGPTLPGIGQLSGVSCPETSDCWAVGTLNEPDNIVEPLIESYDGSAWTVVNAKSPEGYALRSISCVSTIDCWAVGGRNVEHYDGNAWSASVTGSGNSSPALVAVTCVGASDCWAVGGTDALHYDGTGWRLASGPIAPGNAPGGLDAVTCVSSADCWAIGSLLNAVTGAQSTLIWQRQGSDWTSVAATPSAGIDLYSATCVGPSECWAVGGVTDVSAAGSRPSSTSTPSPS
jgi:hypothetical protein